MSMKKLGCAILTVVTLLLCLAVPASAVSDIKLTDETYPTEMIEGNTFSVYGIVTSSNRILEVTIAVYDEAGKAEISYTGKPGTTEYDIHNIDYLMTFSKLEPGKYTYKIVASDTATSDVVLLEKKFEVVSKSKYQTLKITGANYPTDITEGNTFSITGTVTSDYTITAVTCSVRSSNGTLQFTKTATPAAKSYSVTNIDKYMTFSKLTEGTYTYKITASDMYNVNVVLLEKTFTVTDPTPDDPDFDKVHWDVIDLSYWNEITSWDKIARNVDGVILRIGYRSTGSKKIGKDTQFVNFYNNIKEQGVPVGCYFFSAATTVNEAVEEAKFVLKTLRENNCVLEMPVYFDMETEAQVDLSAAAATKIARAFCEAVEKGGYYTGIYCNKFFARDELNAEDLRDYHFWIAQYANACTYDGPYGMWQYSETGSVSGIRGNVDLDYCYYDYPKIIKALGMSGNASPEPVIKPTYSFAQGDDFVLNTSTNIISKIAPEMTTDEFTRKYITLKDGATVQFTTTVGGKIATGTKVIIYGDGEKLGEFTVSVIGDTDMNSKVNSSDALLALQYSVGLKELGPARRLSADMSGDGRTNSTDALMILQYSVGS